MIRSILLSAMLLSASVAFSENQLNNQPPPKPQAKTVISAQSLSSTSRTLAPVAAEEDEFDKEFESQNINKSYYKTMIKQRSKKNPKKYHYIKVRKRKDLKKAGVTVDKKYKYREVYNYTDIKNVHGSKENIGLDVQKSGSMRKTVNIVEMKNTTIDTSANTGTKIRSGKAPTSTINVVEMKNTKVGE